MAFRLDYGRLDKAERTPQGGLRIPAFVTRVGVFPYRTDTGALVRELRHPDEVFAAASLASLEDAPLTVGHPGRVSPEDYKKNSVGHTRNPAVKAPFIETQAIVQDHAAIKGVEDGTLVEVSCGYSCTMDHTPGEYEGEKYDSVQRNILYNHVGLGPRGWGRAGSSVALRLDSGDAIQHVGTLSTITPSQEESLPMPALVTIAGKPYTVGTPEHISALDEHVKTETARADAAEATVKTERARADEVAGKLQQTEKALKEAMDPVRMDSLVSARISLLDRARKILGKDAKLDGKSDREIMLETMKKSDANFRSDASDEFLRGSFETATSIRQDGVGAVRVAAVTAITEGQKPKKTLEQKREDQRQASEDLWKQPLQMSKK